MPRRRYTPPPVTSATAQLRTEKGSAGGYPSLDGTGKVPSSQLPAGTGGSPSGAAGGVLGGSYPNPSFAADMATQAELDAHTSAAAPHSGHSTPASVASAIASHVALSDPHSQYALDTDLTTGLAGKVGTSDSRLTDARTPTSHASSHNAGGSDALAIDAAAATGSLRTLGTGAAQAAQGSVAAAHQAAAAPHAGHALLVHTHPESDVTNLVTDLAAKETARLQARMSADQTAIGTTATALTGLSLALAAATHYRFHAVIMYLCAVTTATLAARVAHSGTLGTNASGESLYKVYGSSGVPTVWAATAKETTQIVSAAIITATGGPGASGTATVPCLLEIEGDIFTGTAGNLTIQLVSSVASGIAPQADSHFEAWVMT